MTQHKNKIQQRKMEMEQEKQNEEIVFTNSKRVLVSTLGK
jgi:hypothetical protein